MLGPGTCLVEYSYAGDEAIAIAVTRDGVTEAKLLNYRAAAIDAKAVALRDACRLGQEWQPLAAELASVLVDPLSKTLKASATRLSRRMAQLITSRLEFCRSTGEHSRNLTKSVMCLRPASWSTFEPKVCEPEFLGIGNPANMAYQPGPGRTYIGLPSLEGAEAEVKSVAGLFEDPLVFIGEDATERAVTDAMPRYSLIHFATHGGRCPTPTPVGTDVGRRRCVERVRDHGHAA